MGSYKKFDESLHAMHNQPAVEAVMSHLLREGIYAMPNDDIYGPDILVYSGFKKSMYVEVEVKRVRIWNAENPSFPFDAINLPERKGKFCRLGLPVEFWILREDLKMAVVIPDHLVTKDKLVEVENSQIASGELFYKINISECSIVVLSSQVSEPDADK